MSTSEEQHPGEPGWVTLADGIRFSRRWLDRHTPSLQEAWQRADTEPARRAVVARILRAAADIESEQPIASL